MAKKLVVVVRLCKHSSGKRSLRIPLGPVSEQGAIEVANQALTLTDSQKVKLGPVTAVDRRGNPAPLAGPVTFKSNDESILTVTDNGDGTAEALAAGPLGNTQIEIADGTATGVIDVTVIAGSEAGLTVAIGTPEEQQL